MKMIVIIIIIIILTLFKKQLGMNSRKFIWSFWQYSSTCDWNYCISIFFLIMKSIFNIFIFQQLDTQTAARQLIYCDDQVSQSQVCAGRTSSYFIGNQIQAASTSQQCQRCVGGEFRGKKKQQQTLVISVLYQQTPSITLLCFLCCYVCF